MIYNQVKANHPNISTNFNSLKQNIYNYIEKEKKPEAKSFEAINLEHPFFTNLNGENLLISRSNMDSYCKIGIKQNYVVFIQMDFFSMGHMIVLHIFLSNLSTKNLY